MEAVAIINFQLPVDLCIVYRTDVIPGKRPPVRYFFKFIEFETVELRDGAPGIEIDAGESFKQCGRFYFDHAAFGDHLFERSNLL